ncbi:MAG TPA: BREX-2 system adenine-specific DNA-methyltransferase PglX [Thermoanaerobaculia bacterium]
MLCHGPEEPFLIDRKALLDDLKKLVTKLEKDLRERCEENAEVDARVRVEYEKAKEAKRTAVAYKPTWRDEWITQVAVAWVLGAVFVRFIEDNELIVAPFIAGPGQRLDFAKEQRTAFFQRNPTQSDREYLEHVFREVAKLPAMKELYDERHNPLWALGVSGDGAKLIREQFQKTDLTGTLVHDFTDPAWGTRFLGDLYQDLSEAARKKYALLQTPEFVEEFILDRTLDPAVAEFGLRDVRMIDPTCGSGHFLLGAFAHLFRLWEQREPATNRTVLAQRALDAVYGVDLNPYAVAISRFRLLLAAMQASGIRRLADSPAFAMNLAVGDSLLHGPRFSATAGVQRFLQPAEDPLRHVYATEDAEALRRILGQQYHAVVGNPPYITVKDKAINEAYRQKYGSCSGKYSLSVPFMERFFELALPKNDDRRAGFIGQITANSFMKREFGAKLIEKFIPTWDLTHVIDTSGAYIPGHGTPTVILFGRNQMPVSEQIRAVMGIRGEPSTPDDPAEGLVWTAITTQIDQTGSTSEWVSVTDAARSGFHKHPWSIGGGGAAELKELLEERASIRLRDLAEAIGITSVTGEDDLYLLGSESTGARLGLEMSRPLVSGDLIRDWSIAEPNSAIWMYDENFELASLREMPRTYRLMWPYRAAISKRRRFGTPMLERGLTWYEWQELYPDKLRASLLIAFAEVATHNHFVLDRGGKVFKQTAPVIKLPPHATEDDHFGLLGLLNSSTACFWFKQVGHCKGSGGIGGGIASEAWEKFYVINGSTAGAFPVVTDPPMRLARALDEEARQMMNVSIVTIASHDILDVERADASKRNEEAQLQKLLALQEELDWACYQSYGLTRNDLTSGRADLPPVGLGERAFEIVLARRIAEGAAETRWFERHGATPVTQIPEHWPDHYRVLVECRIDEIESNPDIRLIEQPEYKRRWNREPWDKRAARALRTWLLTRLEKPRLAPGTMMSVAKLSANIGGEGEFTQGAALYRGSRDFDLHALVAELVNSDAVPALPVDRYKESGLRNRAAWEETWELQRREDASEKSDDIPVPPKYKSSDFKSAVYWSLRGKLDLPKERFISFPGCERQSDPSLPILWAGYDHLQQAKAIAAYYQDLKENEAATPAKLGKLLACILELLPWLKQWHNEVDREYGTRMGDFFEGFMHAEMAGLGLTLDDLRRIRGL